jgi:hypothetical protein
MHDASVASKRLTSHDLEYSIYQYLETGKVAYPIGLS